eukprot:TRINITY_DN15630_c0_g1_i1.p1 TRINITY_DN15630_c0_g1~~TRINITY_DN15630_c0_g1_i1.p1  ORF type:complete len:387 (-),score=80.73 TRINITY_DN15630_c0_g1_i1:212-1372(-)
MASQVKPLATVTGGCNPNPSGSAVDLDEAEDSLPTSLLAMDVGHWPLALPPATERRSETKPTDSGTTLSTDYTSNPPHPQRRTPVTTVGSSGVIPPQQPGQKPKRQARRRQLPGVTTAVASGSEITEEEEDDNSAGGRERSGAPESLIHKRKRSRKTNVQYKDYCDNCLTRTTPQWRKGRRGETFCQDCGRCERKHDYVRLRQVRTKAVRVVLLHMLEHSTLPSRPSPLVHRPAAPCSLRQRTTRRALPATVVPKEDLAGLCSSEAEDIAAGVESIDDEHHLDIGLQSVEGDDNENMHELADDKECEEHKEAEEEEQQQHQQQQQEEQQHMAESACGSELPMEEDDLGVTKDDVGSESPPSETTEPHLNKRIWNISLDAARGQLSW